MPSVAPGPTRRPRAREEIERQIKAVEGIDGVQGRFYRARYLTILAGRTKDEAEAKSLRDEARVLLEELKARRDQWAKIPAAQADLELQELAQPGLDEGQRREKEDAVIALLLHALDLGSREPLVGRRVVELLSNAGRSNDALALFGRFPVVAQFADDLRERVIQDAVAKDAQRAEETAPGRSPPVPATSRSGSVWYGSSWPPGASTRPRTSSAGRSRWPRTSPIGGSC